MYYKKEHSIQLETVLLVCSDSKPAQHHLLMCVHVENMPLCRLVPMYRLVLGLLSRKHNLNGQNKAAFENPHSKDSKVGKIRRSSKMLRKVSKSLLTSVARSIVQYSDAL